MRRRPPAGRSFNWRISKFATDPDQLGGGGNGGRLIIFNILTPINSMVEREIERDGEISTVDRARCGSMAGSGFKDGRDFVF